MQVPYVQVFIKPSQKWEFLKKNSQDIPYISDHDSLSSSSTSEGPHEACDDRYCCFGGGDEASCLQM